MRRKIKIHLIAAARPNFMKIAPLYHALKHEEWADTFIVHTGQHYDVNMSDAFFTDLKLPKPDIHLGIGNGTHAEQTGRVMIAYEKILMEHQPDLVIVVGDVNSTMACTIAASKVTYSNNSKIVIQNLKLSRDHIGSKDSNNNRVFNRPIIAHLEAGLRSFDRSMPEEINRLVTDSLSDILWTPSPDGDENLIKEGVTQDKIIHVGNIMIDSLEMMRAGIEQLNVYSDYGFKPLEYGVVTLHRPSNVDNPESLKKLCFALSKINQRCPVIFPVHPRTRKNLETFGLLSILKHHGRIVLIEPISYAKFMSLVFNCRFVLTDSGGVQEETTYLGIPCLTLRSNTERPITIARGTNRLCDADSVEQYAEKIIDQENRMPVSINLWDGKTAYRVVQDIIRRIHR